MDGIKSLNKGIKKLDTKMDSWSTRILSLNLSKVKLLSYQPIMLSFKDDVGHPDPALQALAR